jgi:hypothetical protein
MAQIKKFSEYFEQPQAQEKQEVKEATSKSIDIAYLAGMDIEKGMESLYLKVSRDLTKSFKGKDVSFLGTATSNKPQVKVEGKIESIEVMEYNDTTSYVTVTLSDGVTYGGVTELTIL